MPGNASVTSASITHRLTLPIEYFCLGAVFVGITAATVAAAETKADWSWIDIAGESVAFLAVLIWLPLVRSWRPGGHVTDALLIGISCLATGFYLDLLDEFFRVDNLLWESSESLTTPTGLLLMTLAFIWLGREQIVINRQRASREATSRDHRSIDPTTDLYQANYLRTILDEKLTAAPDTHYYLIALEKHPHNELMSNLQAHNQMLYHAAGFLAASVPPDALVCRYAGDCFFAMIPLHPKLESWEENIAAALRQFLIATLGENAAAAAHPAVIRTIARPDESAQDLLSRAMRVLSQRGYR